ncbi:hypothetical protein N6H05_18880 [Sphingobium sp. WTD-1]|uniref:hypothetical protein n=1 Tax=Sphingobium sp. WTD-1 TaxID=2979467 RepID=UPI0024DE6BC7|nr:hypothetical protein [Sphingobium sp. WTD-1]WIA55082.1 hypothetical protein N6H05_18880 [Sphingobium sp. WTD-1]
MELDNPMLMKLRQYLRKGDRWVKPNEAIFCSLWTQFLTYSPSYELARRDRAGELTDADRARLPADFDTVLAVYDDFGDMRRLDYDAWWLETGLRLFGHHGEQPRIGLVDVLTEHGSTPLETLMERGHDYITGRWERQGKQPSAILAIPLGLSKTELVKQFEYVLTMYEDDLKYINPVPKKYSLYGTKYSDSSLISQIKCMTIKAHIPEMPLFQIGAVAELSSTYSSRVLDDNYNSDDREALKILTSRALSYGMATAENAARGIFPSNDKCEHAVAPIWEEIRETSDRCDE